MFAVPRRPIIVMDSSKLDYFARAAMVRAGTVGTYGALSGVPTGVYGLGAVPNPAVMGGDDKGNCFDGNGKLVPCTIDAASATSGVASDKNTAAVGAPQTVASWFNRLANAILPSAQAAPAITGPVQQEASFLGIPVKMLVVGGVVVGGGLLAMKLMKKR